MADFEHRPVMLEPTVDALVSAGYGKKRVVSSDSSNGVQDQRLSGLYVDGTFGRGGHSRALLARLGPQARLVVFDKDPQAIAVGVAMAFLRRDKRQNASRQENAG